LTISAPPVAGDDLLRPILEAFLELYPEVSARLLFLDRPVNLVEEGVDIALRIANLGDSSLLATRVGGEVRRVVVASPGYLAGHPAPVQPADLTRHRIIAFTNFGLDSWSFTPGPGAQVARSVHFTPRLTVNTVRAAAGAAIAGLGVTRLYSYHVADAVKAGKLEIVLAEAEHPPLPIHLLTPAGRSSVPKVRAFLDFAAPRLRAGFARLAVETQALG
jgi:DNA-binding transcriptional LysR family regulator